MPCRTATSDSLLSQQHQRSASPGDTLLRGACGSTARRIRTKERRMSFLEVPGSWLMDGDEWPVPYCVLNSKSKGIGCLLWMMLCIFSSSPRTHLSRVLERCRDLTDLTLSWWMLLHQGPHIVICQLPFFPSLSNKATQLGTV